jgi:hypothetical protein
MTTFECTTFSSLGRFGLQASSHFRTNLKQTLVGRNLGYQPITRSLHIQGNTKKRFLGLGPMDSVLKQTDIMYCTIRMKIWVLY